MRGSAVEGLRTGVRLTPITALMFPVVSYRHPRAAGDLARDGDGEDDGGQGRNLEAHRCRREERRGKPGHRRGSEHDAGCAQPIEQGNQNQAATGERLRSDPLRTRR